MWRGWGGAVVPEVTRLWRGVWEVSGVRLV